LKDNFVREKLVKKTYKNVIGIETQN